MSKWVIGVVGKGDGVWRALWGMGLGMDGVVRENEGWWGVCGGRVGGGGSHC